MRRPDWERRLRTVLDAWRHRPFAWGTADCGCLAADAIMAVTECDDPMADLRGKYDSAIGNAKALISLGFRTPADFMAARFEDMSIAHARRGDIGTVSSELSGSTAPLVVVTGHILRGIGDNGLVSMPREALLRCFKIG